MRDKNQSAKVFGEVLKELRLARGFKQHKLAELAKTERSHISALERAVKSPALPTLFILAGALDISASELIRLVEQKLESLNH